MSKKQRYTVDEVIAAIRGSRGIMTHVAGTLGCSWLTVYNYVRRYTKVQEALREEREQLFDVAECNLIRAIDAGDLKMSRFILQTLGKKRGWYERGEHVLVGDERRPLVVREIEVRLPVRDVLEDDEGDDDEDDDDEDER